MYMFNLFIQIKCCIWNGNQLVAVDIIHYFAGDICLLPDFTLWTLKYGIRWNILFKMLAYNVFFAVLISEYCTMSGTTCIEKPINDKVRMKET